MKELFNFIDVTNNMGIISLPKFENEDESQAVLTSAVSIPYFLYQT
ncbi:MAG: hypothetical protein WBA93_01475 [Microcoleaceae cyanobacterium]